MKKFITAAALFAIAIPSAAAAGPYGLAGCGLGSLVFNDDPGFVQVFAATTNGTFGSQTFGITTGTSNCDNADAIVAKIQREDFVRVNYANLSRDIAVGEGEFVAAYATLMGCQPTSQSRFAEIARAHHDAIFSAEADAATVVEASQSVIASDAQLSQACAI